MRAMNWRMGLAMSANILVWVGLAVACRHG